MGGKNKLPMNVLTQIVRDLGGRDVSSYIQSGNVIFTAAKVLAARAQSLIQSAIEDELGIKTPVIIRSASELIHVLSHNPFVASVRDPRGLHVAFLADTPSRTQVAALDPQRSPPDRFAVVGNHVYLSLPNGVAKTKLTNAYIDAKLATTSTVRNWNTVEKLAELATAR